VRPKYELIIIGGGPGGYTAAIRAAQYGLKTALIEERELGGTCLNRGCIPTKALLHTAELYRSAEQEFADLGLSIKDLNYDAAAVYRYKDRVVEQLRGGVAQLLKGNQVDHYPAHGRIKGPGLVLAGEEELETEHILIASGSVPSLPPIPGIDSPGVITSDELLTAQTILRDGQLPGRITIIGGGVIGCEFAGVFGSLGSRVTIVEALDRLVPTADKDISQNLAQIMKKRGVAVHTSATVQAIQTGPEGLICRFAGKSGEQQAISDIILVSTGRRANTAGLLADGFTLASHRGQLAVDAQFRTSVPGVYAIGDVIGGIQLAHKAEAEGQAAAAFIAGQPMHARLDLVPSCIYTDPEIGCVGLTEAEAKEQGREVKVGKAMMSANGKSLIAGAERGFIKLVFDAETTVILGASLMCCRATDMISELTLAIAERLTIGDLAAIIRPHPTFNEAVTEAVEAAVDMAIHALPRRR